MPGTPPDSFTVREFNEAADRFLNKPREEGMPDAPKVRRVCVECRVADVEVELGRRGLCLACAAGKGPVTPVDKGEQEAVEPSYAKKFKYSSKVNVHHGGVKVVSDVPTLATLVAKVDPAGGVGDDKIEQGRMGTMEMSDAKTAVFECPSCGANRYGTAFKAGQAGKVPCRYCAKVATEKKKDKPYRVDQYCPSCLQLRSVFYFPDGKAGKVPCKSCVGKGKRGLAGKPGEGVLPPGGVDPEEGSAKPGNPPVGPTAPGSGYKLVDASQKLAAVKGSHTAGTALKETAGLLHSLAAILDILADRV